MSEAYAELGGARAAAPDPVPSDTALVLKMILYRLKRAALFSFGDRDFVRDLARCDPGQFSEKERAHVMRLAWRYRFQLPQMLRPSCDPDTENQRVS